jgi:hypothetical protein
MAEDSKITGTETPKTRRDFVRTSAQVAVTAPAVALLLNATATPAAAQAINPYQANVSHILDDFTFGNNREDIDARALGSNFNPNNGTPQKDDHV